MNIDNLLESTLIIIPARGGSKGIPEKNIALVNGIPLIEFTINFARELTLSENILVSTDSHKISVISRAAGATCPFLRPKELSTDYVGDMPVIKHALQEYQRLSNKTYELILMLQPTSPIRYKHQIINSILKLKQNNYDSLISVTPVASKFHALKQFEIVDEKLKVFSKNSYKFTARQQLRPSFIRNGVLYLFTNNFVLSSNHVFSENTGYMIISEKVINIDNFEDLEEFQKYQSNSH